MKIYAKTDTGMIRQNNEDAYFYKEKDANNFIAFVCDGMGGHLGGSYAANKTIEILADAYKNPKIKSVGIWLYETLQKENINAILDDREFVTMGAKMKDCKILGTPYLVVIGDKQEGDMFELENIATGERQIVNQDELIKILK